jgi:anti-anti-sigma factor
MDDLSSQAHRGAFIRRSTDAAEIIDVFGEVDMVNEHEFRDSVLQAAFDERRPIVVDLTRCTFICSRGLHVLFDLSRSRPSGSLSVTAPPNIARLFDIVGLSELVENPDRASGPTA